MIHFVGSGWLVILGLALAMTTEVVLHTITNDPGVTTPRSWWLMTGYVVAAAYCIILHFVLRSLDIKRGVEFPGRGHSMLSIPVLYWSLAYLIIGIVRVYSPK